MKQVHSLEILGRPKRIDRQVACPQCSARAMAFEDGSIVCVAEGGICFAPEPADKELFALRQGFDTKNGITTADRLIAPKALADGRLPNLPALHDRR